MKSRNLFICSPNLGILDIALPLINYQRKKSGKSFVILFTKPAVSRSFKEDIFLVKHGKNFFDEFIFISESGTWFKSSSFTEFKEINQFLKKYKTFISRLDNLSQKITILRIVSKTLKKILYFFEKFFYLKNIILINEIFMNIDLVIYDILEIKKKYFQILRTLFKDLNKLSVMHGISVLQSKKTNKFIDHNYEKSLKILSFSQSEKDFFVDFGVEEKDIIVSGILKHDEEWLEFINSKKKPLIFKEPVILFSRSESEYFNYDRKRLALENIKKIILDENKYKLVIKTHFKSGDNQIYYEIFGKENYEINWTFSDDHQFNLASNAKFTITFYSSICIDMLRLGIANIEYLDLRGLESFDNDHALRDDNGHPVFDYRFNDLVIPAQDINSLKSAVKIADNSSFEELRKKYFALFPAKSNLSYL